MQKFLKQNPDFLELNLSIGEMADKLNIDRRTIRIYEQEKLIQPLRNSANRRLFGYKDYERILSIMFLTRNIGIYCRSKIYIGFTKKIQHKF